MRFFILALLMTHAAARAGFEHPIAKESLSLIPAALSKTPVTAAKQAISPPVTRKPAALPTFDLSGLNREEVRRFAREARNLKLPTREYTKEVRAQKMVEKFQAALHPKSHKSVRSELKIGYPRLAKITRPEEETPFLWQIKRFDALFQILDKNFHFGMSELWWLAAQEKSPLERRYRDFLFAGLAAERTQLDFATYFLFKSALKFGIEENIHYLGLFWKISAKLPQYARRELMRSHYTKNWMHLTYHGSWDPLMVAMAEFSSPEDWTYIEGKLASNSAKEELKLLIAQRNLSTEELHAISQSTDPARADWAHLQLARLRAANAQWAEALEHYRSIKDRETEKLSLLTEEAFVETRLGRWRQALGKSIGLQSDFFRYGFAPEVYLLESVSRKALCDYGGAENAVTKFHKVYSGEIASLQEFLKITEDKLRYENAIKLAQTERPSRFSRYLIHLPEIQATHRLSNQWWQEATKIKAFPSAPHDTLKNPREWAAFVKAFEVARAQEQLRTYTSGGRLIEREAKKILAKAQKISEQSELLLLDVAAKASGEIHLQNALNFPVRAPASAPEIPSNKNDWGYKQEIWEDEIEFLESVRGSRCVQDHRES